MGVGSGHGKLLLFGEHAAVYGHPALGVRLAQTLEVRVEPGSGSWIPAGVPTEASEPIIRAATRAAELTGFAAGPRATGGRIEVSGDLPTGLGFGSSAAFCLGLLRAMGAGTDALTTELEQWEAAHELERFFHGTPSGIDTGLAVYPGASELFPNPPGLPRREPVRLPPLRLLVGALPRPVGTGELVAGVRRMREERPEETNSRLERLGSLSRMAARAEDHVRIAALAREAHEILSLLGLSTPGLDAAILGAQAHGGLGGKLSGAGGGGAFFVVLGDQADAEVATEAVRQAVRETGDKPEYLAVVDWVGKESGP